MSDKPKKLIVAISGVSLEDIRRALFDGFILKLRYGRVIEKPENNSLRLEQVLDNFDWGSGMIGCAVIGVKRPEHAKEPWLLEGCIVKDDIENDGAEMRVDVSVEYYLTKQKGIMTLSYHHREE